MIDIKTLQEENEQLKRKLKVAQTWMKREITEEINKISKAKISNSTLKEKTCFINDNIEDIITDKIQDFFGEIMLLNIPASIIRNIISAEINYYNFRHNPSFD
jgi:predicted Holliday junction resolvase-like endonuclease